MNPTYLVPMIVVLVAVGLWWRGPFLDADQMPLVVVVLTAIAAAVVSIALAAIRRAP